jgi:hypothetical protein
MAPEVGLEPTTLRLTGEFHHSHEVAPPSRLIDYKRLMETEQAPKRTKMHEISI